MFLLRVMLSWLRRSQWIILSKKSYVGWDLLHKSRGKVFTIIKSTIIVTSECSQKKIFPIYQLNFLKGLRLMG